MRIPEMGPTLVMTMSIFGCLASSRVPAHAGTIGIDFDSADRSFLASAQPGLVAGGNWNNIRGTSGSGLTLVDNSDFLTTAVLGFSACNTYGGFGDPAPATGNAATNSLYTAGIDCASTTMSITITNIPYLSYDVYVFASEDPVNTSTRALSMSDGLTTFYYAGSGSPGPAPTSLLETVSTTAGSPTVGHAQYQLFSESSSTLSLVAGGGANGVISNNVFGLEIVDTSAPEPGTLFLFAAGAGLLGVARRAKRLHGGVMPQDAIRSPSSSATLLSRR